MGLEVTEGRGHQGEAQRCKAFDGLQLCIVTSNQVILMSISFFSR